MLTPAERTRLNALRDREAQGETLSPGETAEVATFLQHLDAAEAAYLTPATEKLRRENEAMRERQLALNALLKREEQFVARLSATIAELQSEREAIAAEKQRLLAGTAPR